MRNAVRRIVRIDLPLAVVLLLLGGMLLVQTFEALRISPRLTGTVGAHPISVETVSDAQQALRHSLPRALGATAVHTIIVDTVRPPAGVSGLPMRFLHGTRTVTEAPFGPLDIDGIAEAAPRTLEGFDVRGPWRVLLVDVDATVLVATAGPGGADDRMLVDARLVPEAAGPADLGAMPPRTLPQPDRTLLRDVAVDGAILTTLLLIGGLMLPAHPRLRAVRAPLGLLVGVGALATTGLLLVPGTWSLVAVGAAASAVAFSTRRRGHAVGWRREDLGWLAVHLAMLLATVTLSRARGLFSMSADSFTYLLGARALALGQLAASQLDVKRLVAQQALHAPGFAAGVEGFQALGPVLLVAGVGIVALLPLVAGVRHRALPLLLALGAAGLIASSQWLWFMASYVNNHVLVAAILLGLVLLWWFTSEHPEAERAVIVPVTLMLATIVLSRAEAVLIVGLLLAGTLITRDGLRWRWAWQAAGGLLLVWNTLLVVGGGGLEGLSAPVLVGLAGGAILLTAPAGLERIPAGLRVKLPSVVLALLWAVTAGYLLIEVTGTRPVSFFGALRTNLGLGEGGWGVTAPFLLVATLLAVWSTRTMPASSPARTLVIGFVPITLIAKMADGSDRVDAGSLLDVTDTLLAGGGRIGWGDSGNRMLTHVTLTIVFLLVVALLRMGAEDGQRPGRAAGDRLGPARTPLALIGVSAILAFAVLRFWDPQNLSWPGPAIEMQVHSADVGSDRVTLADGDRLTERIELPPDLLPADTATARVCAELLIANPDGGREGALELTIEVDGMVGRDRSAARFTFDDKPASVCVELSDRTAIQGPAVVTVTGEGGTRTTSLDVVLAQPIAPATPDAQRFVRDLTVGFDAPSTDPRPRAVRAVSVVMRRALLDGPALALLAVTAVTVAPRRRSDAAESERAGG